MYHDCVSREVALEFFNLDNINMFLGGWALYYLGIYGYGADVTTVEERSVRCVYTRLTKLLGFYTGI
jgi:hypothetical protein